MSSKVGDIVEDIKTSSMQRTMKDSSFIAQNLDYNYKLAHLINLFLIGKSNRLHS